MALFFAVGLSVFAGSEPGWLSQNWNYVLNSNGLEDSRKIIVMKTQFTSQVWLKWASTIVTLSNVYWSTSKATHIFYVNASNIDGIKRWHVMIFAFFKTDLLWESLWGNYHWKMTVLEAHKFLKNGAKCSFARYFITHYVRRSVHLLVSPSVGPSIH